MGKYRYLYRYLQLKFGYIFIFMQISQLKYEMEHISNSNTDICILKRDICISYTDTFI